jgi:hypothetical protein
MLVEYTVYRWGRLRLRISSWRYRVTAGSGGGADARKLARIAHRIASFAQYGPPNWRIVGFKTIRAELTVLLTYWIVRPLPGAADTPALGAARTLTAVLLLLVARRWIDRLQARVGLIGEINDRLLTPRMRPVIPIARVTQRIRPYRRQLDAFLQHATGDTSRPGRLLFPGLAQTVARNVVRVLQIPSPKPELLTRLVRHPELRERAARVLALWESRHRQHRRAVALIILLLASNRAAVGGAGDRSRGRQGAVLRFHVRVLDALVTEENLAALGLPLDAAEILRGRAEAQLLEALALRRDLRIEYLEAYRQLLYDWIHVLGRGGPSDDLSEVDEELIRVDAQLEIERF